VKSKWVRHGLIERDLDTGYYVGYMPEFPGAHSQGLTIEELHANLVEVVTMLREDPDPPKQVELIGTQQLVVA